MLVDSEFCDCVLVHICCSVDSHHFLSELRAIYPNARLVGYFYNPNIHPIEEYELRLLDVKRSCNLLNIELLSDEYDVSNWLNGTEGLEDSPEKGERCGICFDVRLHKTAKKARELGIKYISTTLLTSPMKPQSELFALGENVANLYNLGFVSLDTRSNGGTQKQQKLAKDAGLYRQNYCGCLYALKIQRNRSDKQPTELFCPLSRKRYVEYPINQRLSAYTRRVELEAAGIAHKMYKKRQMFYYPFFTRLFDSKGALTPCYTLSHSLSPHKNALRKQKFCIEFCENGVGYSDKGEIFLLKLDIFNELCGTNYASITQLLFSPPSLSAELGLRAQIEGLEAGVSIILVVQDFAQGAQYSLQHSAMNQEEIIESVLLIAEQAQQKRA